MQTVYRKAPIIYCFEGKKVQLRMVRMRQLLFSREQLNNNF